MTEEVYKNLTEVIDGLLGNPNMEWSGDPPHDFRQEAKDRGVFFISSGIYSRNPHEDDTAVYFKILVGNEDRRKFFCGKLAEINITYVCRVRGTLSAAGSLEYDQIEFMVPADGSYDPTPKQPTPRPAA